MGYMYNFHVSRVFIVCLGFLYKKIFFLFGFGIGLFKFYRGFSLNVSLCCFFFDVFLELFTDVLLIFYYGTDLNFEVHSSKVFCDKLSFSLL
ncbi:unnamed protein product [Enterobius vermicularis]|uniref:Uncharacterized protein n=1 Tax=Enterobius vermicularis TaxID=51028 RepID=A0A0N4V750_ENTVE|nr:unnamed protein product [Enterobius vermicularis]